jgi:hypothetical protein
MMDFPSLRKAHIPSERTTAYELADQTIFLLARIHNMAAKKVITPAMDIRLTDSHLFE